MTANSPSPTVSESPAAEQAAIAAVSQRVVAAWANQDADAFADVFTPDGTLILPGLFLDGRDAIRSYMAAGFDGPYKGTRVTGQPIKIKFLDAGAAVLITQGGVLAPGETEVSDARAIRASWIVVKEEDGWRLAAYQNSPRDA
ncbi:SgcJ/EcaC family oxidoreductase [Phytohabitans flavus]|uniref:DUF4440 domain-containing protein n=1 Tax=Phytohabitans flavus TaxID=1076124 RepID=A0A6F8XJU2_9ACTN|nr:SgcJ/EcaC family oxidoreductase [Phytohabitans flavus]BCB74069.1 hypothetical protein Pflav_004790 [Phytohabitans flavus]